MSDAGDLLAFALTDRQREVLTAYAAAEGNARATARTLGCSRGAVLGVVRKARARAEAASLHTVMPAGQRLKGRSTLTDAAGVEASAWTKTERASEDPAEFDPVPRGFAVKRTASFLDGQGNVRAQWVTSEQDRAARFAAFEVACADVASKYTGLAAPTAAPEFVSADWLCVYPLGDPHIGMLAWEAESGDNHDLRIGEADLKAAIDLLADCAPPAHTGYLLNLGDFFHAQDDRQQTPGHGHKLDVDGRWNKVVRVGLGLLVHGILRLLQKHARVVVGNVPGNHDPDAARMIAIYLEAFFRNEPRVTIFDNSSPYHAFEFGANLIATAHGDGVKREGLPGLVAARWPEMWGRTKYRVCYSGHIHHETRKEFDGLTVESFRTLAAKDAWHSWKGYGAGRSLDVISHHTEYGPSQRSTVDIRRVRHARGETK